MIITEEDKYCPFCDEQCAYTCDDGSDYISDYFYFCYSNKPFYHIYKECSEEILYFCNDGKIVIKKPNYLSTLSKVEITFKDQTIFLNTIPEFDPKNLPAFIKAAVGNIAFL